MESIKYTLGGGRWEKNNEFFNGKALATSEVLTAVLLTLEVLWDFYILVLVVLSYRLLSKNLKIKIYKTIILPVFLYGCETWSLTLREERKLRVFENMVFRRIFGPRRDEVTGEWRRLHNEELNDLCSSPIIVLVIKSRQIR